MSEEMDLTTAAPSEIDAKLAELERAEGSAEQKIAFVVADMHYGLGERATYATRNRKAWPTTDKQAIEAVRAKAAAGEKMSSQYSYRPFAVLFGKYEAAVADLEAIYAQAKPLNDEFVRRGGWSRFFLVQGGHYHRDMTCSTCNKNGLRTRFGWNPEMSGMSEDEAIAEFGRRAAVLCSVCFPNAPVEMYEKRANPNECPGGQYVAGSDRRTGMSTHGECPTCHGRHLINAGGAVRKHSKPTGK